MERGDGEQVEYYTHLVNQWQDAVNEPEKTKHKSSNKFSFEQEIKFFKDLDNNEKSCIICKSTKNDIDDNGMKIISFTCHPMVIWCSDCYHHAKDHDKLICPYCNYVLDQNIKI